MKEEKADSCLSIALDAVVLECKDVQKLATFYCNMLGWQKHYAEGDEWVDIISPDGGTKIAFQRNDDYLAPVWPDEAGAQQQMAHLDFTVHNPQEMEWAVQHAVTLGASMAKVQYDPQQWVTLLDPAGHPFCFVLWA